MNFSFYIISKFAIKKIQNEQKCIAEIKTIFYLNLY